MSSQGKLDANHVRQILISTTILSSDDVMIENIDENSDMNNNNNKNVPSSVTTTVSSLWISSMNTMIVFLPDRVGDIMSSSLPSMTTQLSNHHNVTTTSSNRSNITCWTVPVQLLQELRSLSPTTTPPPTSSSDFNIITDGYIIRLPSNESSRIVMLPEDTISLSTNSSSIRRNIIQQIRSVAVTFPPNHIGFDPEPTPSQPNSMVDVPLFTPNDSLQSQHVLSMGVPTNSIHPNVVEPKVVPSFPKPTIFPSLESKLLTFDPQPPPPTTQPTSANNGTVLSYQPMTLNSQTPIPFETDLFRGHMIMILRPPNDPATEDPFWYERIFQSKKRRCIINVQGQFKSVPQGIVYAGAEVSQPMRLGLVIKGICTILLKLVERFNSNIHSSFGTSHPNDDNLEAAHIVAPAYTFYERLVVTSPDEPLPSILDEIIESPESIQRRKTCTSLNAQPKIWNTTDTYTFSFYSMYIDLPTWQLVGLPASGDIGLQTFWGSSLLRICMYDKTNGLSQKQHILSKNRYAFSVQIEYLGKNGEKKKIQNTMESPKSTRKTSDDYSVNENSDRGNSTKPNDIFYTDRRLRHNLQFIQEEPSYQAIKHNESQLFLHESSSCDESMEGNNYDDDDLPFFDAKESHSSFQDEIISCLDQTRPVPTIDFKLIQQLSIADQYCPYWVELCIPSRNGSSLQYVTAFACCVAGTSSVTTTFRLESECDILMDGSVDNCNSMTSVDAIDTTMNRFSSRMSSLEKKRRCIGLLLSDEYGTSTISHSNKMVVFRGGSGIVNSFDNDFLSLTKIKPTLSNVVRWSGFIARAYSDRHWVEEWVCLYERHITFRHLERRKSSEFVLLLSNIIRVEKMNQDVGPYNSKHPILAVSTVASTVYLMFVSESALESWCQIIDPSLLSLQMKALSNEVNRKLVDSIGAAADDLLHKSSIWNCKSRRILNCGSYHFRINGTAIESLNPLTIAEHALRQATEIATSGFDSCTEQQLFDFIRSAAMLKLAFVSGLDEASRLAFYLNVYHTMISHAYLVLGPPDSSLKWINYFNNIAYQVGDDIFSLTELEHSIIRANMSYPTQFLSRFIIPKSAYPTLALTISDCRINFALNCGSLSNPSKIILYQPQHLHQQLDDASRLYLLNTVTYRRTGSGDLELKLPRICQWFADDFGNTRSDMLSAIEPYLPNDVQHQLDGCRLSTPVDKESTGPNRYDMSSIIIRYHSYNFECRPLSIS